MTTNRYISVIVNFFFIALLSMTFVALPVKVFSQDYFEDTWYGYKSGEYDQGRFPFSADMADVNNDGHNDMIIGQFPLDAGFKVMLANGDGSFGLPVHYNTIHGIETLEAADLNDDGYADIVLCNSGSFNGFSNSVQTYDWGNSVSVFLNNGDGTFTDHQEIVTALHPEGLTTIDFDSDGDQDVAVAHFGRPSIPGNTVIILENDGNGNLSIYESIVLSNFPFRVVKGYINDDNLPDLVVGHESSEKTILINSGGGFDAMPFPGNRPTGYNLGSKMSVSDMDNDGDDDIVFFDSWGSSADYVNIYKNDGQGNFSDYQELMYPLFLGSGDHSSIGDVNGDGWPDIVSASFNGESGKGFFLFESDGSGGFLDVKTYTSGSASPAALIDDTDHDGDNDILIVDYSMSVNVHENPGDASFPLNMSYGIAGPSSEDLDAADIDLDGDIDVITSSDDGFETDISVLMNNGDGTFADYYPIQRYSTDQGGAHAKLRDMNGDGYPDILFVSPATNIQGYLAFIAFNNGNGGFDSPVTLEVSGCGWGDVEAADIDNDGDLDIIISEFLACLGISDSGKRLFFLLNNGDGSFAPPFVKIIGDNPESMTMGDFDSDGNIDLVTAHYGPYGFRDYIQVHAGDGNGDFMNPDTYIVGRGPHDVITADFNNDGVLDLATGNTGFDATGIETMSVLIGNGDGSFQGSVTYDAPYSSTLLGNSGLIDFDVDHDGDQDILLANQSASNLSVYINDGAGNFAHLYRVGINGYNARGLAKADYNGDNLQDVAVITAPATGFLVSNALNILFGKSQTVGLNETQPLSGINGLYLEQNFPNPFRGKTTIGFSLEKNERVRVIVHDLFGRSVQILADHDMNAGDHSIHWNAYGYGPGIYFCRIQTGSGETKSIRMVIR